MLVIEFDCGGQRFGLPLSCVRRAVMSAQPAALPGAGGIVMGVLNVAGETVTVLDFAQRAGRGPTAIAPSQQFLIVELDGFLAALVVDRILGVAERAAGDAGAPPGRAGAAAFVDSIVRLDDGVCLVLDPERFLFEQEKAQLAAALEGAADAHA